MQDAFKPTLHSELSYKFYNVGEEKTSVLVIDNFINNARSLVDFCDANTKFSKVNNVHPGLRMAAPRMYIHAINQYLAELLNNIFRLTQDKIAGGKALYSMVVTPPDQLEINQCLPHTDSYLSGDLAYVHYLESLQSPTQIYGE
ncbi:MAG: hypothetical protein EOO68_16055 [Moraxellaceae bacterium]|nr:MAG: hypothetical protein EOO68_16055 [Moraxellaceae bacterium]